MFPAEQYRPNTQSLKPGVRVMYAGVEWHVWAQSPKVGNVWIARTDDEGKARFADVRASSLRLVKGS